MRAGQKLDKIYRKIGDRGAQFAIFFVVFAIHTVFALQMKMISIDPNEFGVAAWSALYAGRDWSGVMQNIGYYYGYVGALLYTPIMLIVKDPFLQYKLMLIMSGLVVSFVPVIGYRICRLFGVNKAWQRILISLSCGVYSTVFAHTKFIWNETACIIFPWLILLLIIKTGETRARAPKHLLSILTAFVMVAGIAAHPRLTSVVIAGVLMILFARLFMKKKLVLLPSFLPAFGVFLLLERLLTHTMITRMWGSADVLLLGTFRGYFTASLPPPGENLPLRFIQTFFGHLYYLFTSTWGLGALAVCLTAVLVVSFLRKNRTEETSRNAPRSSPRNTTDYNKHFILFAVYAFCANFCSLFVSVADKFRAVGFYEYQDTVIFGRYMDSTIPLLMMLVICYVFMHGLDFRGLLGTIVTLGATYAAFFIFTAPVIIGAGKTRVSPILGLYPIRMGERIDAVITLDGLLLTVSGVFCFASLFLVIVCCSKRYRAHIISLCVILTMVYSSIYTAIVYLPFVNADTEKQSAPVYELSAYIYNSADAPGVYVYDVSRRTCTLLQFLNQYTKITIVQNMADIPDNCFIVVPNSSRIALRPDADEILQELAQTAEYTVYAYGERAAAFAQSQLAPP